MYGQCVQEETGGCQNFKICTDSVYRKKQAAARILKYVRTVCTGRNRRLPEFLNMYGQCVQEETGGCKNFKICTDSVYRKKQAAARILKYVRTVCTGRNRRLPEF